MNRTMFLMILAGCSLPVPEGECPELDDTPVDTCDDTADLDGDGLRNCEDDDDDGDGLRDAWDADATNPEGPRGPTQGFGTEGDLVVDDVVVLATPTRLVSASADALEVEDASGFAVGDELLVLSQQGVDHGAHQLVFVADIDGAQVSIEPALTVDFDAASAVLVQRVPHFDDVTVTASGVLTAEPFGEGVGGVVALRAKGRVDIDGAVDVSGLGFRGGRGVEGNQSEGEQGEGALGPGLSGDNTANAGGGGAALSDRDQCASGAGGAYGEPGAHGLDWEGGVVSQGGDVYGDVELNTWNPGSGGGAGAPDDDPYERDGDSFLNVSGDGGDGGGVVALWAGETLRVDGVILADGTDGADGVSAGGEVGAGGGGAGGQILLSAMTLELYGEVSAEGGLGGTGVRQNALGDQFAEGWGGDGGAGRVRLDCETLIGQPVTAPGHEEDCLGTPDGPPGGDPPTGGEPTPTDDPDPTPQDCDAPYIAGYGAAGCATSGASPGALLALMFGWLVGLRRRSH